MRRLIGAIWDESGGFSRFLQKRLLMGILLCAAGSLSANVLLAESTVVAQLSNLNVPEVKFREAHLGEVLIQLEELAFRDAADNAKKRFVVRDENGLLKDKRATLHLNNVPFERVVQVVEMLYAVHFVLGENDTILIIPAGESAQERLLLPELKKQVQSESAKQITGFGNTENFVDALNRLWIAEDYDGIRDAIELRLRECNGDDFAALLAKASYLMGYKQSVEETKEVGRRLEALGTKIRWQGKFSYEEAWKPIVEVYKNPEGVSPAQWSFEWSESRNWHPNLFPAQGMLRSAGRDQYGK